MLSVLIPTYNYNVYPLVFELKQQLDNCKISYEIIVIDDASKSEKNAKNQQVNNLQYCSFDELKKNIGRASVRNLLVSKSAYKWLLFLDADVFPRAKEFISIYLKELQRKEYEVIVGGIYYKRNEDSNKLRWKLGKKGEEQLASKRNIFPYHNLLTGNFLIEREVFKSVGFDENLKGYGYEDLLFGKELKKNKISLIHIDNEVCHLGIDCNEFFVKKTKEALNNLRMLITSGELSYYDTKISYVYKKSKRLGLTFVLSKINLCLEWVTVKSSSLFFYNLFRLAYLHKIFKNTN